MKKEHTSIRLSAEDKQLRAMLAAQLGISENAVLILALRELAIRYGLLGKK